MPSDSLEKIKHEEEINALVAWVDCKTVGFFSKSVKKSVKRGVRRLTRASLTRPGEGGVRREKPCFQPRSRPIV